MSKSTTDFEVLSNLQKELEQLEGIQKQDPEKGTNVASDVHFYNRYTNRLFGAPYQLLDKVDKRFPDINENVGNEYLRNFLLNAPILEIKAGIPMFTYNQNWVEELLNKKIAGEKTATWLWAMQKLYEMWEKIEFEWRMFTFENKYAEYMANVNYFCRTMAYLLNLQLPKDKEADSVNGIYPNGVHLDSDKELTPYNKCRWEYYKVTNPESTDNSNDGNAGDSSNSAGGWGTALQRGFARKYTSVANFLAWAGLFDLENLQEAYKRSVDYTTKFLVEPISVSETLTNQTTESLVSRMINGLDDSIGNEVAFLSDTEALSGTAAGVASFLADKAATLTQSVTELAGWGLGGQYIRNLVDSGFNALRGQQMIYPKIYKSSEYNTSTYKFVVHLNSPYGDIYNYYMNIIVPLGHLICLAAPRMISANGIKSPFIIQASIPGMCTINMGIINSMTITKNKSASHVSVDGFPLDVDVEFTIEELYSNLPISSAYEPASFLANESLNEYLASMAGLRPSFDSKQKLLSVGTESFSDYTSTWSERWQNYIATGENTTAVNK